MLIVMDHHATGVIKLKVSIVTKSVWDNKSCQITELLIYL